MVHKDNMNVIHANAAGLDVHKMEITASVRRARPEAEAEVFTENFNALPSGLGALTGWLREHRVTAAVMEATGIYWMSVHDALEEAGIQSQVVHAQHVKQIKGRKTDVADSIWLARICQFGMCRPSLIAPPHFRGLRRLSRQRRKIVSGRATTRNRVHKIIDGAGVRVGGILTDAFGVNGRRILDGLAEDRGKAEILASLTGHVSGRTGVICDALSARLTDSDRFILKDLLWSHDADTHRIMHYDRLIYQELAEYRDQIELLMTIPGIDRSSAAAVFIELGPFISAFDTVEQCAAWAGLCPGNNESAGKRRSGKARKGNSTLRAVLTECAHGSRRTSNCQFKGYHKALMLRRGYKRATVATAHKLLRIIYAMLCGGELYRDPETDYEAMMVRRNTPRWIKMMLKHGVDLSDPSTWTAKPKKKTA